MATANDRVLGTPELFEAILLELDMETLLLSQSVNTAFKDAIDSSIKLQRALWFKPTPPKEWPKDVSRINPLLKKHEKKLHIHQIICNTRPCHIGPIRYSLSNFVGMTSQHNLHGSFEKMLPIQGVAEVENWLFWDHDLSWTRNVSIPRVFFPAPPKNGRRRGLAYDCTLLTKGNEPLTLAQMMASCRENPWREIKPREDGED